MRRFKSLNSFHDFERSVKRELRFVRNPDQENFLKTVIATSQSRATTLPKGFNTLWRARIGHDWIDREVNGGRFKERRAYKPQCMKPCPNKAGDGRANPRGIPCLYMATLKTTAILEVRPWIGAYVSIAQLCLSEEVKIIDCTQDDFDYFDYTHGTISQDGTIKKLARKEELEENEKMVWGGINRAFSMPSQREDESIDYIPTQILAERFKLSGFGGIAYKSNFGGEKGFNIALFNLDAAEVVGRVMLCRVDDISIKITTDRDGFGNFP
jgi:hypothetical protein